MATDDYYAILGVPRTAGEDEVKKAYRRLTREYHPDRNPDDVEVQERFRKINQAYTVLGDAGARARYDASMRLQPAVDLSRGFDGQTARDLLGNVFGDVFGVRRRERRRGRDLRYTLTVDLEEAVLGGVHEISFEAPGPCTTCSGTGTRPGGAPPTTCPVCGGRGEVKGDGLLARRTRCGRCDGTGLLQSDPCTACRGSGVRRQQRTFNVRIPPGTEAGSEKIVTGQGEPGRFGGAAGDLRVTINVRPHAWLTRHGDEIRCELPLSVTEAARGARLAVPTVDGVVRVEVPRAVRSGTKLRLRGKGAPKPPAQRSKSGKVRGDQLVTVVVETPVLGTSKELDAALDALEAACSGNGDALPQRDEYRRLFEERDASEAADGKGSGR